MDRLEEHIRNNREDLDRYNPPAETWDQISKELKKRKSISTRWISIAAMVVVVLGSAILLTRQDSIFQRSGRDNNFDQALQNASPELKETEIYYTNLIKSLYQKAAPLLTANPEADTELKTDILYLDSICLDIKKDLKDNVDNQEVVEALIQNYRIKIRILEDMLTVLKEKENDTESEKTKEDEI